MGIAYAHGLYDRPPEGIFQLKWDWDPTLLFFAVIALLYIRGLKKFKNKSPVEGWQKWMFFTGIATLIVALLPPIDPLSDQLFFMHMVQHLLITLVGVPLMIFGVPFFVIMRGAPNWFRRHVYFPILRNKPLAAIQRTWTRPLVALIVYECVFWFWHLPLFYNMALLNDAWHLLEHGSFALAAMFLWRNVIDPHPMKPAPLPLPARMLLVSAVMLADILLSAFLTFADDIWYAYDGIPLPDWWEKWGHLEDQKLGGLIMWIPGGTIYLIAMTALFFVWVHREEKKEEARLRTNESNVTPKEPVLSPQV